MLFCRFFLLLCLPLLQKKGQATRTLRVETCLWKCTVVSNTFQFKNTCTNNKLVKDCRNKNVYISFMFVKSVGWKTTSIARFKCITLFVNVLRVPIWVSLSVICDVIGNCLTWHLIRYENMIKIESHHLSHKPLL